MVVKYKSVFRRKRSAVVSCYQESKVDPDNPPPHVREAAADLGVSVHYYKEWYLDRPTICEATSYCYKMCMRVEMYEGDTSECQFLKEMWEKEQCEKFEKKYFNPNQEAWWNKHLVPFIHRHFGGGGGGGGGGPKISISS